MRTILTIILILFFAIPLHAQDTTIVLNGKQYNHGKGITVSTIYTSHGIKLGRTSAASHCQYEIELSSTTLAVKLEVIFENPNRHEMDIFVWNYGSRPIDPTLKKQDLDSHWILWESTRKESNWESRHPAILILKEENGIIDFLGKNHTLKLLLYADSNESFDINQIKIDPTPYQVIGERVESNRDVWLENGKLFARGIGMYPSQITNKGSDRANTLRAAKVEAMRRLVEVIYGVEVTEDKITVVGELSGLTEVSAQLLSNGMAEVILELPLANINEQ